MMIKANLEPYFSSLGKEYVKGFVRHLEGVIRSGSSRPYEMSRAVEMHRTLFLSCHVKN